MTLLRRALPSNGWPLTVLQNAIENGKKNAIYGGMTTTLTLGKAGRVVLPKRIREKMHLQEGSRLRLELVNDKIELSQEPVEAKIVKSKDGFPVIMGWEGYDAAKAVREARQEYLDRLDGKR